MALAVSTELLFEITDTRYKHVDTKIGRSVPVMDSVSLLDVFVRTEINKFDE